MRTTTLLIKNETFVPLLIRISPKGETQNWTDFPTANILQGHSEYFQPFESGDRLEISMPACKTVTVHVIETLELDTKPIVITEDQLASGVYAEQDQKKYPAKFYTGFDPEFKYTLIRRKDFYNGGHNGEDDIERSNHQGGSDTIHLRAESVYRVVATKEQEVVLYWLVTGRPQNDEMQFAQYSTCVRGRCTDDGETFELGVHEQQYRDRIHKGKLMLRPGEVILFDKPNCNQPKLEYRRGARFWFFPGHGKTVSNVSLITGAKIRSYMTTDDTIVEGRDGKNHRIKEKGSNGDVDGLTSFRMEHAVSAKAAGIRFMNSLTKDILKDVGKDPVSVMRSIITFSNPKISKFWIESSEENTAIYLNEGEKHVIGLDALEPLYTLQKSKTNSFTINMTTEKLSGSLRAPVLFLRHDQMAVDDRIVIYPDLELHHGLSKMKNPGTGKKLSTDDLKAMSSKSKKIKDHTVEKVQDVVQKLASTIVHSVSHNSTGIEMQRVVRPTEMGMTHIKMDFDSNGNVSHTEDVGEVELAFNAPGIRHISSVLGESWWDHAWDDLKSFACKVEHEVDNMAESAMHVLVQLGDDALTFTCNEVHKLTSLIVGLLKAIALEIEKLIEFLLFLLEWEDIIKSMHSIEKSVSNMIEWAQSAIDKYPLLQNVEDLVKSFDKRVNVLENNLDDWLKLGKQHSGTPTNPIHNSIIEKGQWVMNTILFHGSQFPSVSGASRDHTYKGIEGLINDQKGAYKKLVAEEVENIILKFLQSPENGFADMENLLRDCLTQFFEKFKNDTSNMESDVRHLFENAKKVPLLQNTSVEFPVISHFATFHFNPLQLMSLILAVPWTVYYKIENGHAPSNGSAFWSRQSFGEGVSEENKLEGAVDSTVNGLSAFGDLMSGISAINNFQSWAGESLSKSPLFGLCLSVLKSIDLATKIAVTDTHKSKLKTDAELFQVLTGLRAVFGLSFALLKYGTRNDGSDFPNAKFQNIFDILYAAAKMWYDNELREEGLLKASDGLETAGFTSEILGPVQGVWKSPYLSIGGTALIGVSFTAGCLARLKND